jgi:hypothetical protein
VSAQDEASVDKTISYVKSVIPEYKNKVPTTTIIEPLVENAIVSYIYDTSSGSHQVVTTYNYETKEVHLIQNEPISSKIVPYFYEETKDSQGQTVVTSNNLTEIESRVKNTEVLVAYLKDNEHSIQ